MVIKTQTISNGMQFHENVYYLNRCCGKAVINIHKFRNKITWYSFIKIILGLSFCKANGATIHCSTGVQ